MEEVEGILNLVANYSILIVIAGIFIWDSITNKKKTGELEKQNNSILLQNSACLQEMTKTNSNISKTLEILQVTTSNTNSKIEKIEENIIEIKNKIERK